MIAILSSRPDGQNQHVSVRTYSTSAANHSFVTPQDEVSDKWA